MIRESMPVTQKKVYLNTGAVGPLSTITSQALQQGNQRELVEGRSDVNEFLAFKETKAVLRRAFAGLVKAAPEQIALTHHTTDGMNTIAHGLNWRPGDEIVTTNFEHPGGLLPLYVLRQRFGVVVKVIAFSAADVSVIDRLQAAITPRTRLLAISHVTWNTGSCLPLAEIVAMAHRYNVLVLVDGAQAVGAMKLNLPASGVDFYAMPGQKWLCGPEGIGAMYIRSDNLNVIAPTYVGYASMDGNAGHDWSGNYMPHPDARRYEVATVYRPAIRAMIDNLVWLDETVGWEWIHHRIASLAEYAYRKLNATSGVTVLSPGRPQSGLVVFNLDGYDPARVVLKLSEEGIILRFLNEPAALRISTGFYNNEEDIDRLIAALQAVQEMDPDLLPVWEG